MTRVRLALPVLAMLAASASACTSTSTGQPVPPTGSTEGSGTPSTSTSGSSAPSGDPFGSVDPCALLTAAEVQQFQADPGTSNSTGTCKWSVPGQGVFGLTLRGDQGLNDIVVTSGQLSDDTVGGRKAKRLVADAGPGNCMISIQVGANSRVDVQGVARTDTDKACDFASRVAGLIEPRLPKGE